MKLGTNDIGSVYLGTNAVQKVYLGTNEVWSAAPPTPLLDDYPNAAAAYSLRLLRTAYTGSAIRVRRASDNTEQDIGFVNNELDTSTLTSFCSGTNGFVKTWYDQSGNGRDATQTTAANQPQIVSSGSVIVQSGKPSIDFAFSNTLQNLSYSQSQPFTAFYAGVCDISEGSVFDGSSTRAFMRDGSLQANRIWAGTFLGTVVNGAFKTIYGLFNGASSEIKTNDTTAISGNIGSNSLGGLLIGDGVFRPFDGRISELIIYGSNKSSNQVEITNNINNFYSIY